MTNRANPRLKKAAALAALIDRAAKLAWAAADFVLIPGVLGVRGTRNTGMAFGMLGGRPYLLAALTAGVMIALFVYLRKKRLPGYAFSPDSPWQKEFEDCLTAWPTGM